MDDGAAMDRALALAASVRGSGCQVAMSAKERSGTAGSSAQSAPIRVLRTAMATGLRSMLIRAALSARRTMPVVRGSRSAL